jgi:integrase
LTVLKAIRKLDTKSEYLFPSPRRDKSENPNSSGYKPITPDSISRALLINLDKIGLDRFTPHDLRRTAASQMTATGISRLVVSKILNHVESGITAVYDRHSYDEEKRQALDSWGRKLQSIVTGKTGNVIPLRKTS